MSTMLMKRCAVGLTKVISKAAQTVTTFITDLVVLSMGVFDFTVENSTLASRPWKDGKDYWCSFELYPEWKGNTFYLFKGVAHHRREYMTATEVVVKTFRHIDGTAENWKPYKDACILARKLSREFNKHLARLQNSSKIWFVMPTEVVMDNISDVMRFTRFFMRFKKSFSEDEVVLFEDFLDGDFKTFVSRGGKASESYSDVLESFCHYVYHQSGGEMIFSNLKGTFEDDQFRLTCPDIHSKAKSHGASDNGEHGIHTFFRNHSCTGLCKDFIKPDCSVKTILPTAPLYPDLHITDTKESCIEDTVIIQEPVLLMSEPPRYEVVDSNKPPSYESCVIDGLRHRKGTAQTTSNT